VWIAIPRKFNLMEFRGIRYTIRTGIERGQWIAVIHPGVEVAGKRVISGTREHAELYARRMIDSWLKSKGRPSRLKNL
jgi:hypothetical protein